MEGLRGPSGSSSCTTSSHRAWAGYGRPTPSWTPKLGTSGAGLGSIPVLGARRRVMDHGQSPTRRVELGRPPPAGPRRSKGRRPVMYFALGLGLRDGVRAQRQQSWAANRRAPRGQYLSAARDQDFAEGSAERGVSDLARPTRRPSGWRCALLDLSAAGCPAPCRTRPRPPSARPSDFIGPRAAVLGRAGDWPGVSERQAETLGGRGGAIMAGRNECVVLDGQPICREPL